MPAAALSPFLKSNPAREGVAAKAGVLPMVMMMLEHFTILL
jgi:hypothetical protein